MSKQSEFWDERYAGEAFAFGEAPNAFLAGHAHRLAAGMRALVPGDGEGRNGVWLAQQGLAVTTLDLSPVGVEKAKRLAAARGVTIDTTNVDEEFASIAGPQTLERDTGAKRRSAEPPCNELQGYDFDPPKPLDQMSDLVHRTVIEAP